MMRPGSGKTWALIAAGLLVVLAGSGLQAQVTFERLLAAEREPHNWLTYSGTYSSTRYSLLDQVNRDNVSDLEMKWIFQAQSLQSFEATPSSSMASCI